MTVTTAPEPVLRVQALRKYFPVGSRLTGRAREFVRSRRREF